MEGLSLITDPRTSLLFCIFVDVPHAWDSLKAMLEYAPVCYMPLFRFNELIIY
jgi:hypothetical protein